MNQLNINKMESNQSIIAKNFGRKSDSYRIIEGKNSIIYTRISDPEQEKGQSLAWQKKYCEEYCKKNNYTILEYFGGSVESAKTDERKEFQKMLKYIKNSKNKVTNIVVYCIDRFSRAGSTWLVDQLRTMGVRIISVTQPTDTNTPNGRWFQKMQMLLAEFDNEMRKDKSVTGMREKLLRGEWIIKPPIGYEKRKIDGKIKCVIDENGKYIRKAFQWKANENVENEVIRQRLEKMGIKLIKQRLSQILKNPFYCGYLTNKLIDGQVVKGNHEPLISEELFLKVNNLLSENNHGYHHNIENDQLPLKVFIKCQDCGTSFCGYEVKKKHLFYYKCAKKGCKCNRSAKNLHNLFLQNLETYSFNSDLIPVVKKELLAMYDELYEQEVTNIQPMKTEMTELKKDLEVLNERWALGKITDEVYEQFAPKYKLKIKEIESVLGNITKNTSNLENQLQNILEYISNIMNMWKLASYTVKQRLQYLIFPEGMRYDRENDTLRTTKVNPIFAFIACGIGKIQKIKKETNLNYFDLSPQVIPLRPELRILYNFT